MSCNNWRWHWVIQTLIFYSFSNPARVFGVFSAICFSWHFWIPTLLLVRLFTQTCLNRRCFICTCWVLRSRNVKFSVPLRWVKPAYAIRLGVFFQMEIHSSVRLIIKLFGVLCSVAVMSEKYTCPLNLSNSSSYWRNLHFLSKISFANQRYLPTFLLFSVLVLNAVSDAVMRELVTLECHKKSSWQDMIHFLSKSIKTVKLVALNI